MRRYIIPLVLLFSGVFLYSCENEEPTYPFTIQVKTFQDSVRVNNVRVIVYVPGSPPPVEFIGFTNEDGLVQFEYDREAIFEVRALRGSPSDPSYIGCERVRLMPDQNVVKPVYIKPVEEGGACTID